MDYWTVHFNRVSEQCDDSFLEWCTENSVTQLEVDEYGAALGDDAVLDFCFGPHGSGSDPRHLKARFECCGDFLERLFKVRERPESL